MVIQIKFLRTRLKFSGQMHLQITQIGNAFIFSCSIQFYIPLYTEILSIMFRF